MCVKKNGHLFPRTFISCAEVHVENEVRHLMALKEVNAKESPEMTQEESFALQDLHDAFVLASAVPKQGSVEDLIEDLDTKQTSV